MIHFVINLVLLAAVCVVVGLNIREGRRLKAARGRIDAARARLDAATAQIEAALASRDAGRRRFWAELNCEELWR